MCSPAAVLDDAGFDGSDAAVVLYTGLQVDDGAGPSAMCPENFFARIGDLHRAFGLAGCDCGDDFKRDHFALATKASADQRFDHANLRHWHVEDERKLVLQVIRDLSG